MLNNIKSFGLNVIPENQAVIEQTAQTVGDAISSLWEPILSYIKENDNVFSGEVNEEIDKINYQAMRLNMSLSSGERKTNINFES